MRIGFASDIHRLVEGRRLILSGVVVPFELGEEAHSDGDVVYHAVAESILGALALGDLGKHFPDTDDKYKDIDSSLIVKEVAKMMKNKGFIINNIDVSITLEKPKLKDYIGQMRANLATLLDTEIENISIKAGTNERLDSLGRNEAVKAESIVLLKEGK
ncbi:MAG: 2-C-methyl-D-erythritol 2,4-cyclodiphosphate synthase [Bacilli bacterium]|nr:2-C-methyl-D-erythritol 2,4-cyclodiphosphate synthase [Bacilli bacterium]